MVRLVFGLVGAVAAVLYWRYAVFVDPSASLAVLWSFEWRAIVAYTVAGFAIGWVIGFALSKIGGDY